VSGPWSFELVDLSRPVSRETAVALFGDLGTEDYRRVDVTYLADWSTANGSVARFSIFDHIGTHMDAPIHTNEDGVALEGVDISRLIGEAVVLDLYKGDVDYGYTVEDLAGAKPEVRAGDIVLIYSGYRDVESASDRIKQTYLTPEAAQWLVDRGVKAVGCEPAGIEHLPDGYFVHRWYAKDTSTSWKASRTSSAFAGNGCASPLSRCSCPASQAVLCAPSRGSRSSVCLWATASAVRTAPGSYDSARRAPSAARVRMSTISLGRSPRPLARRS
jgi:kynurenine formamidase